MNTIRFLLLTTVILIVNVSSYGQISTNGLIAYFPFNGNANDESGNGNEGIVNGATLTNDRFENENSAYFFDGVDDHIESTSSPFNFGYGPFTFSVWIKIESIDFLDYRWGTIIEKRNYGPGHKSPFLLLNPDSTIAFGAAGWYTNPKEFVKGSTHLDFHKWYHIVGVRGKNSQKLYINGELDASETMENLSSGNSYNLFIGRRQTWLGDEDCAFTGVIDDIRIYNREVGEDEVDILFSEGGWIPPDEPIATMPFGTYSGYPFGIKPSLELDSKTLMEYNKWKSDFVTTTNAQGYRRVIYEFEGENYTASEGIGYGMLLSVYANDKDLFDDFYKYYSKYQNRNGLMCWKIPWNGEIPEEDSEDYFAAIDGDQDVAMALILASYQWPEKQEINYEESAKKILESILNHGVYNDLIMPGDVPYTNEKDNRSDCINPSYFAPAYYPYFKEISGNEKWIKIRYNTIQFMLNHANHHSGLIGDFCNSKGGVHLCNSEREMNYSYDASRIPWRFGLDYLWHGDILSKKICEKIQSWAQFSKNGAIYGSPSNILSGYSVEGSLLLGEKYGYKNNPIIAGLQTGAMVLSNFYMLWLDNLVEENIRRTDNVFYNRTTKLLSLFVASGNFWPCIAKTISDEYFYTSIRVFCPVDIEVQNSSGQRVNKYYSEIPNSLYIEMDFDGDGELDDEIFVLDPEKEELQIIVKPEPQAEKTDSFSLVVVENGEEKVIVEDELIGNISEVPYIYQIGNSTSLPIIHESVESSNNKLNVYPNPAKLNATISYSINSTQRVVLLIYNSNGKEIQILFNQIQCKGDYHMQIETSALSSGLYFCKLQTNSRITSTVFVIE